MALQLLISGEVHTAEPELIINYSVNGNGTRNRNQKYAKRSKLLAQINIGILT